MNTQEQSYKARTMERFKIIITLSKVGGTALFMKNPPLIYKLYQYILGYFVWTLPILAIVCALTKTDDMMAMFESLITAIAISMAAQSDLLIR